MARPLTSAEREELALNAYELSLKGFSLRAIAQQLGSTHKTIASVLAEEKLKRRGQRKDTATSLLDSLDRAAAEAWRRLESLPASSASPAGAALLNTLNSIARTKMDILGFKAPTKTQSESVVYHGRIESELDKLSGTELRAFQSEFESMLRKYFPEDYGELDGIGENGIDMRQIGPSRNHGEIG